MHSHVRAFCTLLVVLVALTVAASAQGQPTVSVSPSTTSPGSPVTVTWTAPAGSSSTDWIGIYDVAGKGLYNWWYTNGATSGSVQTYVPIEAGDYELRYGLNDSNTIAARSRTLTVQSAHYVVDVSPKSSVQGEISTLTVSWTAD